ncbi:hypothetical protein B0T17DRAFT_85635 [Bombardia bombarda]|uniref:DUF7924 domain-containing protein n=1 Tax=Bombardia bombarda TaxID=252184 RepID=A0AA39XMF3_9PEZI|nr:hypothetical protein B0T17DRAFT_85635 [Bombardia bombarda]
MAPRQTKRNIQKVRRQRPVPNGGTRPQGIKKEPLQLPSRKSARLQHSKDTNTEPKHLLPSLSSNTPGKENRSALLQDKDRKRKRAREPEEPPIHAPSKRQRTSAAHSAFGDTFDKPAADGIVDNKVNLIAYWIDKEKWPEECFEQDEQTWKDLESDSWFEEYWEPENNMSHVLARKKSSSSLCGKPPEASSGSTTPSDQKQRTIKSSPYKDPRYKTLLATKGSFMDESDLGITGKSKIDYQTLLSAEQQVPNDSLFRDDLFKSTCRNIQDRNETRVIRDISLLIVPSAETLATYGATNLQCLIESTNEGWTNSIAVTKTHPQPDYSVGFRREAFTDEQLKRLEPLVGDLTDTSLFMATYYMYFPFLTCEVKCGASALDIADRQNAHSMTMAARGIVELFRLVKREKELHREILAFSISHDHETVRIYGHYPVIDGNKTTFYRHPIRKFDFTELDGKEKWTAYKFTKNVYDIWMPTHLKRICSVIDELPPDLDFEVSQQSEPGEYGLSQELESHHLSDQSSHDAASLLEDADSQSSHVGSRDITPDSSLSQRIEGGAFKSQGSGVGL